MRLGRLDDLVSLTQIAQWLTQPGTAPPTARTAGAAAVTPPESVKKKLLNIANDADGPVPLTGTIVAARLGVRRSCPGGTVHCQCPGKSGIARQFFALQTVWCFVSRLAIMLNVSTARTLPRSSASTSCCVG